jgi:hypothetical protein
MAATMCTESVKVSSPVGGEEIHSNFSREWKNVVSAFLLESGIRIAIQFIDRITYAIGMHLKI